MPRTKKNFAYKRSDLLSKVWAIFLTNGYENTTLALILKELNISKGVFYHYFSSKEECAKSAVDFYSCILVDKTMQRCQAQGYEKQDPVQRLKTLFEQGRQLFIESPLALDGINSSANKVFHEMLMVSMTKKLSLVYAEVIQQGVADGCFQTGYPLQLAEMMLVLSSFYFDLDFFEWDEDSMDLKVQAYQEFISNGLGIKTNVLFS